MQPFYFGSSDRPLFGVFAPGHRQTGDPRGVLLCYPMGVEYLRAHRAFRQLASLLTRAGFGVLRFDYSCTGDSWGGSEDAELESWITDVGEAIDELKENAGVSRVVVVGLRLGATLAMLATRGRTDVERVVLWDPVASGRRYLDDLLEDRRSAHATVGVAGFPMTPALVAQIDQIDLTDPRVSVGVGFGSVSLLASTDSTDYRELIEALRRDGARLESSVIPSDGAWANVDPFGSALIPDGIIRAIVESLRPEGGVS